MRNLILAASLLLTLPLAGCTDKAPAELADCPTDSSVTFATASVVFDAHCTRCHASTVTGTARESAPDNWDYDTAAAAVRDPDESWRRIYTGNMPPDGEMDEAEKLVIWEWCSCDGPE